MTPNTYHEEIPDQDVVDQLKRLDLGETENQIIVEVDDDYDINVAVERLKAYKKVGAKAKRVYLRWNAAWGAWEQVSDHYAGRRGVVAFDRVRR